MSDGVKFIFKTLIKVPFIIFVSFFIFNIFAFTVSYFRIVGASNTLQQAIMDNNYLVDSDKTTFENYTKLLKTNCLDNIQIIVDTDGNEYVPGNYQWKNEREQYGNVITCGITARFKPIIPLIYTETLEDGKVRGYGSTYTGASGGTKSSADLEKLRKDKNENAEGNITVVTKVVGMQYYSDLATN